MIVVMSPEPVLPAGSPLLYLTLAALLVLIGLRFLKRAVEPFAAVVEAVAAAAVVSFALGTALILMLAAALVH